jgi:hypothetical protein
MLVYSNVQEIYSRNTGTTKYYRRSSCSNLVYTDGVLDFQLTLDAYWVVDNVISYIPCVLNYFNSTDETFYIVRISFNKEREGYMEIFTEGYIDEDTYSDHITVIDQKIPYIELPINNDEEITEYKMYLQVGNYNPLQFVLLLPSEY